MEAIWPDEAAFVTSQRLQPLLPAWVENTMKKRSRSVEIRFERSIKSNLH